MTDISHALEAKSDQLNAMDIIGCNRIIKITDVDVKKTGEQLISIRFEGDHSRPWKPSKGMSRILASAWGIKSEDWIGKHVELFFEPSVVYAGKEVGGIRIKAVSDIKPAGIQCSIALNRTKREPYHVQFLVVEAKEYPQERFAKALPVMAERMKAGEMTLQQVIAQCQKTGQLSQDQVAALEESAPVLIEENNNDDEVM